MDDDKTPHKTQGSVRWVPRDEWEADAIREHKERKWWRRLLRWIFRK